MKKIMEESKSPLSQARPINPSTIAQVSPFAGLLAGNSVSLVSFNVKMPKRIVENQGPPPVTTWGSRPVFQPFQLGGPSHGQGYSNQSIMSNHPIAQQNPQTLSTFADKKKQQHLIASDIDGKSTTPMRDD